MYFFGYFWNIQTVVVFAVDHLASIYQKEHIAFHIARKWGLSTMQNTEDVIEMFTFKVFVVVVVFEANDEI